MHHPLGEGGARAAANLKTVERTRHLALDVLVGSRLHHAGLHEEDAAQMASLGRGVRASTSLGHAFMACGHRLRSRVIVLG